MLERYASKINCEKAAEESELYKYKIDAGNVYMAYTQSGGIPKDLPIIFNEAIKEIEELRNLKALHIMINKLEPNIQVPIHRDYLKDSPGLGKNPCLERWHLPIRCDELNYWFDACNGEIQFQLGIWLGPLPYWISHYVYQNGRQDRIHIIVDLDSQIPVGYYSP